MNPQTASWNDRVTIHFTARNRDGGIVEDSQNRKPVSIQLNDPQILPALRRELVGMRPGDVSTILLEPDQVFGNRNHSMQLRVPVAALPSDIQAGTQLSVEMSGQQLDVSVVQIDQADAVLDLNHPLAGEAMEYTIRMISIGR